ncbi:MAG: PAS domain S-box protein [Desulfurivibrio sp.]|nr:MAG: PAS domain S-box protein [Desulfurivibrio sp.]
MKNLNKKTINVAIVGGGPGCKALMDMIFAEKLDQLHMNLIAVSDTNPEAVGYRYAQEHRIYTTTNYRDLYKLKVLNMIIELAGSDEIAEEISRSKPAHIRLMDHMAARLFWDVFKIEEEMFAELKLRGDALRKKTQDLNKRVKELRCIFGVTDLIERLDTSFEEIFQGVVNLIPPAFQYQEIACARISYQNQEYLTENYKKTEWNLISNIVIHGERVGLVEVCYLHEKSVDYKGPFLKEEKDLVNAIAKRLGRVIRHRQAEDALQESEERYRTMLDACPDPVVVYDMEGKCTYINPAFTQLFGWSPEERLGQKLDYVPEKNWPETRMMIDKVRSGKSFSAVESRRYTKEGKILDVSISAAIYSNRNGTPKGSVHILHDITSRKIVEQELLEARDGLERRVGERTAELMMAIEQLQLEIYERKRAVEQLKASEQKYRVLFNYDPNPLFMVEMKTARILDLNKQATEKYQYSRKELLGTSFIDLFNNDDNQRIIEELLKLTANDEYGFMHKLWARKKDGGHFFVDLHARVGKFRRLHHESLGLCLIIRTVDITRGLERDAQLIQAGKMATLGEMATGIAHELNQPLNVIQVGSDFLAKMIRRGKHISEEQLLTVTRNINEQVDRAVTIINHLREFGRRSDFRVYPVDVNKPIEDVFTIMGQQLKLRNIDVILKLGKNLPKIMGDKNRLEQIFLNLVTNARDALDAKESTEIKKLTISTYEKDGMVVALVSDTGTGISKHVRDKIFEPFFTTKEVGKGTGLGLSITYNLVKDFQGDISVESVLGVGATFTVRFPAYREKGVPG